MSENVLVKNPMQLVRPLSESCDMSKSPTSPKRSEQGPNCQAKLKELEEDSLGH